MVLFVGDDWAEAHHDIEIQDGQGRVLVRRRLPEGLAGMASLHGLLAEHADLDGGPDQVIVGIETDRGPWVQALLAAGYRVFPINPIQASRYRERHTSSGAKSDPGDAHVLAEIVRVDRAAHRPMQGDTAIAEQVKITARAHQSMIWTRQRSVNTLRSMLRDYYPGFLAAFDELAAREALVILQAAPTPEQGAKLTMARLTSLLRRAGRKRRLEGRAEQIQTALRAPQLVARPAVVAASAAAVTALAAVILVMVEQTEVLAGQVAQDFGRHPDAEVLLSQPGLGAVLAARVLAEFGDDPTRYIDAKARKNYAGTPPITKASGTKRVVLARYARNRRLADALYGQAFCALTHSSGCRRYYDQLRDRGASHNQALRTLSNRLVGIPHGCLKTHTTYNENTAWPAQLTAAA